MLGVGGAMLNAGPKRRRSSLRQDSRDSDDIFESDAEEDEKYFEACEFTEQLNLLSDEEAARETELRTEIIYLDNRIEESMDLLHAEEQLAQGEVAKQRATLEAAQDRERSVRAEIDRLKGGPTEAAKRRLELAWATMTGRMLRDATAEAPVAKITDPSKLRCQRDERVKQVQARLLEQCGQRQIQIEENYSTVCAELEDLRQGGTRWKEHQLATAPSAAASTEAPSEAELRRCRELLAKRQAEVRGVGPEHVPHKSIAPDSSLDCAFMGVPAELAKAVAKQAEEGQEILRLKAEVDRMQQELQAGSKCSGSSSCGRVPLASATTSAGTTPRQTSEASASPASTPRAPEDPSGAVGNPDFVHGMGPLLRARSPAAAVAASSPPARLPPSKGAGKGAPPPAKGAGKGAPPPANGTGKGAPSAAFAPAGSEGAPPLAKGVGKGAPPPSKGAGSAPAGSAPKGGKGQPPPSGKGGPPKNGGPPPPGKGGPAMGKSKMQGQAPRSNGLVNVTWKSSAEPKPTDLSLAGDKLLGHITEFLETEAGVSEDESEFTNSATVFAAAAEGTGSIAALSTDQLQEWFRAVPFSTSRGKEKVTEGVGTSGGKSSDASGPKASGKSGGSQASQQCPIDEKVRNKVSILLQRYKMKFSQTAGRDFDAVLGLHKAVLTCKAPLDQLDAFQDIVLTESETCVKVHTFVKALGTDAASLGSLEPEHRLIHAVYGIPQVADRIQCLIFEARWPEEQRKCCEDLQVLYEGMKVLTSKREPAKKFFQTALHLGNALNKDNRCPVANRGFRLETLPKLLQLKSSTKPQATLLHMTLSLMEPAEVKSLINDLSVLSAAKDRKTYGVWQRCQELLNGLLNIERLSKSIPRQTRTRMAASAAQPAEQTPQPQQRERRRSMLGPCPSTMLTEDSQASLSPAREELVAPIEEPDPDDLFHDRMQLFLEQSRNKARWIAMLCKDVFDTYWELAVYFEDPLAVYPPPQKETDPSEDIFVLFYKFFMDVEAAQKDIARLGLREEIAEERMLPSALDIVDPLASSSSAGTASTPRKQLSRAATFDCTSEASPEPQAAPSDVPLDKTALRRLRTASTISLDSRPARANSATRGSFTMPSQSSRGSFAMSSPGPMAVTEEDSDGQSDVSDWEASPRKASTSKTRSDTFVPAEMSPTVAQDAKESPSAGPPPRLPCAAASPVTPAIIGPPPRRRTMPRRPPSASPSPSGRGRDTLTPNPRDRAYMSRNASGVTAAVASDQASPSANTPIIAASPSFSPSSTTDEPSLALGPLPARRACSMAGMGGRSLPLQSSPSPAISVVCSASTEAADSASQGLPPVSPLRLTSLSFGFSEPLGSPVHALCFTPSFTPSSRGDSPPPNATPISATPPKRSVVVAGPPPKRNNNRKSLSHVADRLSMSVANKFGIDMEHSMNSSSLSMMSVTEEDDDEEDGETFDTPRSDSEDHAWMQHQGQQRRASSSSSGSSDTASSPGVEERDTKGGSAGAAARARRRSSMLVGPFAEELKKEVKRRSCRFSHTREHSRKSPRTARQRGGMACGLTPVQEPGETPQSSKGTPQAASAGATGSQRRAISPRAMNFEQQA